jgi:hypothetical protein
MTKSISEYPGFHRPAAAIPGLPIPTKYSKDDLLTTSIRVVLACDTVDTLILQLVTIYIFATITPMSATVYAGYCAHSNINDVAWETRSKPPII